MDNQLTSYELKRLHAAEILRRKAEVPLYLTSSVRDELKPLIKRLGEIGVYKKDVGEFAEIIKELKRL